VTEIATQIQLGSSTMARLVDDLLDFSRLEQGQLSLERSRVAVADVLAPLVQTFRAQPNGERIVAELPEGLEANLDRDRLVQMVSNLLANALRYAPTGPIVLRATRRGDRLRIEVADEGPGIAPAERERIWEKFYRTEQAISSPNRGSGLGLAVVKQLVELHGGQVGVRSSPHRGTTFWFTLPIGE
jgi:signal transduction histidine kinase